MLPSASSTPARPPGRPTSASRPARSRDVGPTPLVDRDQLVRPARQEAQRACRRHPCVLAGRSGVDLREAPRHPRIEVDHRLLALRGVFDLVAAPRALAADEQASGHEIGDHRLLRAIGEPLAQHDPRDRPLGPRSVLIRIRRLASTDGHERRGYRHVPITMAVARGAGRGAHPSRWFGSRASPVTRRSRRQGRVGQAPGRGDRLGARVLRPRVPLNGCREELELLGDAASFRGCARARPRGSCARGASAGRGPRGRRRRPGASALRSSASP